MKKWLSIATATCFCGMTFAADRNSAGGSPTLVLGVPISIIEATIDRDDYDAGQLNMNGQFCEMRIAGIDDAVSACRAAYDVAYHRGIFEQALRFAAIGCGRDKDSTQCRQVAELTLRMGGNGTSVADAVAFPGVTSVPGR